MWVCDCGASVVPGCCCCCGASVVPGCCCCCGASVVPGCCLSVVSQLLLLLSVVVSVLSQMGCASCAMPSMSMLFQAYDSLNLDGFPFDFSDLFRYSGVSFAPKYASDAFSADIEFLGLAICLLRREPLTSSYTRLH